MSSTESYDNVVHLARKLVSIPSVNPVLADDPSIAGERALASFLAEYLAGRGFRTEFVEETSGRPNLIATAGPDNPRRSLIIEAHLDTQGVHGMTVPPFGGEVRNGRLYGRGACDMKGPMAAALVNLTPERVARLERAGVQLRFIGAIGEETGNIGAIELVDRGMGADEVLVLEPTDQHIVHAHKGVCWFEVELLGRAAHGSNPDAGRNAIVGMSRFIDLLYRHTEALDIRNDVLGRPTINAGIVRGGTSINIVPERCILECDRRMLPGESGREIRASVQALVDRLASEGVIEQGHVIGITENVPFETGRDSGLVRRLGEAIAGSGIAPVTEGAAWYSDAGPFSRTCREVAVFGPGSIRQAHTADEYIEIAELQKGADILGAFLDRTIGDDSGS